VTSDFVKVVTPHFVADKQSVAGAIYGTVSVMAVIAGASHKETSASRVLAFAAISSLAIWAVHVYAATLASAGPHEMPWGDALRHSLHHEIGVLEGVIVPLFFLLLGTVGWMEDRQAIWWSMWSGCALLVLVPLVWMLRANNAWWKCLFASAIGGLLGLVLTGLKVLLH
jgi:hypothetical protein